MSIFEEFDNNFNANGVLADAVKEQEENGGNYEEVPSGDYEVKVENIELKKAKSSGRPMVSIWYRIIADEFDGKLIFQNQVVSEKAPDVCINIANQTLKSFETDEEVKFENFKQWNDLMLSICEKAQGKEYHLSYTNAEDSKNGFPVFKIVKVLSDNNSSEEF